MREAGLDCRQTEVSDLDLQVFVKEDVIGLEITMNDVLCTAFQRRSLASCEDKRQAGRLTASNPFLVPFDGKCL